MSRYRVGASICAECFGIGRVMRWVRFLGIAIFPIRGACRQCGGVGLDRTQLAITKISPPPPKPRESMQAYRQRTGHRSPEEPGWESYPAVQGDRVIGYQVRWSEPDADGKYLWVGHYFAGKGGEPSIAWSEQAADSHAKRLNDQFRAPWEFRAHRDFGARPSTN